MDIFIIVCVFAFLLTIGMILAAIFDQEEEYVNGVLFKKKVKWYYILIGTVASIVWVVSLAYILRQNSREKEFEELCKTSENYSSCVLDTKRALNENPELTAQQAFKEYQKQNVHAKKHKICRNESPENYKNCMDNLELFYEDMNDFSPVSDVSDVWSRTERTFRVN